MRNAIPLKIVQLRDMFAWSTQITPWQVKLSESYVQPDIPLSPNDNGSSNKQMAPESASSIPGLFEKTM